MSQALRLLAIALIWWNAPLDAITAEKSSENAGRAATSDLPSPLNWPEGRVIDPNSNTERQIREVLQQPAEFQFSDAPLGDVADWIQEKFEITVELDAEALAADGKGADLPMTKQGRFSSLANALSLLLEGRGLTHLVKHDVLLITTKTAASAPETFSTRLYQVHDLVVMPNDPTVSRLDFDSLIELITNTVRQQDWQDNGGTVGFVKPFQGPGILALAVTHDERGHREVEQLLKMLREARVLAIAEAQARQPLRPPEKVKQQAFGGLSGGSF